MLNCRLPVALDGKVRRLVNTPFAQAFDDLAQVDAALFHALLRVFGQNDTVAVLGDSAKFFEKPGIGKLHRLDSSRTNIVYGFLAECQ